MDGAETYYIRIKDFGNDMNCPLCTSSGARHFADHPFHGNRRFDRCPVCQLIFASPSFHLSKKAEKERYDHHQNDPADGRYQNFLRQLVDPLQAYLKKPADGLDFGCGPGPAIGLMMASGGHRVVEYDPFYAPDTAVLGQVYDFVTCTEVVEHFYYPRIEFERLNRLLLKPGGYIGLMTQLVQPDTEFKEWWYANDETHVSFYSLETFQWICGWLNWKLLYHTDRVIVCVKNE